VRQQTIQLHKGWNAVFLDVEPLDRDPAQLLTGTPFEIVAAFFPQTHPAPYIRNPGDAPWREEGWAVWYAPSRPDAAVTSLHAVSGYQPYLVQSATDYTWKVSGRVKIKTIRWQPDSYNLVGFSIDPAAPPTFEKFFAPSSAHRGQRIYRLVDGVWSPINDPARDRLGAGEAYWVYCAGGSDYQGPLRVRISGETLQLGRTARDTRVELVNVSSAPSRVIIESGEEPESLPLAYVNQDLPTLSTTFPALPRRLILSDIEGGRSQFLRLAARREAMTAPAQTALLRISNGEGVQVWLPVAAEREP
jgi:hypothetical protein